MKILKQMKSWLDRPLSMKVFYGAVLVATACFLFISIVLHIYDVDMFFMVATGREILENGIPYENVWAADSGMAMTAQQWLYCVFLAVADSFGSLGLTLLVLVQVLPLVVMIWRMWRRKGMKTGSGLVAMMLILLLFQTYLFSVRPQVATALLLLWECLSLERFGETGKHRYLFVLPVGMLLEANLHVSMWPFHFCVLLAYEVPAFWAGEKTNMVSRRIRENWKQVILAVVAMTGIMFVNPYGADGVLYVLRSMFSGTFRNVDIVEMQPMELLSPTAAVLMVLCVLAAFLLKAGKAYGSSLNMLVGFGLLSVLSIRNYALLLLPGIMLFGDVFLQIQDMDLDWRKDIKNSLLPLLVGMDVLFVAGCVSSTMDVFFNESNGQIAVVTDVAKYVRDNSKDGNIFVSANFGALFQYVGCRNVYMDCRPELYMKELNEVRDVLPEYSVYAQYGDIQRDGTETGEDLDFYVTKDAMDAWFDGYEFAYVCIFPQLDVHLGGYMLGRTDYELVEEQSSDILLVYRLKAGGTDV